MDERIAGVSDVAFASAGVTLSDTVSTSARDPGPDGSAIEVFDSTSFAAATASGISAGAGVPSANGSNNEATPATAELKLCTLSPRATDSS